MSLRVTYTVQQPFQGRKIYRAYADLASSTRFMQVTGLYAFASLKGAKLLAASLSESPDWRQASKRWVMSIDGGITEPAALSFLLSLRNSEVRVPDAESLLETGLKPNRRFHPKTLLLERGAKNLTPTGLLVGSANMTLHGLSLGHEHTMSLQANDSNRFPPSVVSEISALHEAFEDATPIDQNFIDRYSALRPRIPKIPIEDHDDERSGRILQNAGVLPPQEAAAFASLNNFWTEIRYVVPNLGPGKPGNQIDMRRGARVFFGFGDGPVEKNTVLGDVNIEFANHASVHSVRFGNNLMDKLTLPIPGVGGPPAYSDSTLLFTKVGNNVYRMAQATKAEAMALQAKSKKNGTLFFLQHGGRAFGLF